MKILLLGTIVMMGSLACKSTKSIVPTGDNSMNALDWPGTYYGITPCADCDGIETVLSINKDLNYTLKQKYLGKSTTEITTSGTISWSKDGGKIALNNQNNADKTQYRVGENNLTQLDRSGNIITGNIADKYVLAKQPSGLTEKYWKLVELNGQPVIKTEHMGKEPHMILRTENKRVSAHGGCNVMNGTYTLEPNNRIRFSQMMSTLMACKDMQIEDGFSKALASADNYYLEGDKLVLNKARMAPLARFEAVYFK